MSAMIPAPRCPITIRPATMADIPFIDSLQKMHKKQVGFLHRGTLEGKIEAGHVLVAWAARPCSSRGKITGEHVQAKPPRPVPRINSHSKGSSVAQKCDCMRESHGNAIFVPIAPPIKHGNGRCVPM